MFIALAPGDTHQELDIHACKELVKARMRQLGTFNEDYKCNRNDPKQADILLSVDEDVPDEQLSNKDVPAVLGKQGERRKTRPSKRFSPINQHQVRQRKKARVPVKESKKAATALVVAGMHKSKPKNNNCNTKKKNCNLLRL